MHSLLDRTKTCRCFFVLSTSNKKSCTLGEQMSWGFFCFVILLNICYTLWAITITQSTVTAFLRCHVSYEEKKFHFVVRTLIEK